MKRFHVILIKPSRYDEDGYVISWFREARLDVDRAIVCMVGVQTNQFTRTVDPGMTRGNLYLFTGGYFV